MISVRSIRLAIVVLLLAGLTRIPAAVGASAVEELARRMPEDVVAFVGTSGGDALEGDFDKTIAGRIWNDRGVRTFYQSVKTEVLAKIAAKSEDPNLARKVDLVFDGVRLALSRPVVIGAAQVPVREGPPIAGFAILDAVDRKAELAAVVDKLEAMIGRDDIGDREIGSLKLRAPADSGDLPLYWGWIGDHFVIAVNDAQGAAVKHVSQPHPTPPASLGKVPGHGDALVLSADIQRVRQLVESIVREEGREEDVRTFTAVLKRLGLDGGKAFCSRVGFAGPDVVVHAVLETPTPPASLFGAVKPIDPSWFGAVDAHAVTASAVNVDLAGVYDTIMETVQAVSPARDYAKARKAISDFESQAKLRIREGLLASLAGPVVSYSLPVGMTLEAPRGGLVAIMKLRDARLFKESMTALGEFAAGKAEGMLQIGSQERDDGRKVHVWTLAPLAIAGMMPTWSISGDHVVFASGIELCDLGVRQLVSKGAEGKSLLDAEGFKKAASGLPQNLLNLTYVDSSVQFSQTMMQLQQVWPMLTMVAGQQGVRLPVMLPSLAPVIKEMSPSISYTYHSSDGLHSFYRGSGVETRNMSVGGVALGMGILMPALARVRQLSFRMTSGTNLSGIGKSCFIYANDHDDRLPPDLETLVTESILSPESLESKLKPEDFEGPSYIYIPGQDLSMYPGNVVAYENPEFCVDGLNVLFLDSHVEFMKPEEFRRELEETYRRLNRPTPMIRFQGEEADDEATEEPAPLPGGDVAEAPRVDPLALLEAARQGNLDQVRTLLDGGTPIDVEDNRQETPLTLALKAGHVETASLLIERGANVNAMDDKGRTALDVAEMLRYEPVAATLRRHGGRRGQELASTVGDVPASRG